MAYLTKKIGIKKNYMILSGRKTNENMKEFILENLLKLLKSKGIKFKISKILILGYAFKENCNDVRNSKVIEIFKYLRKKVKKIDLYDPIVKDNGELLSYKKNILKRLNYNKKYDVVVLAVKHDIFKKMNIKRILSLCNHHKLFVDLKSIFDKKHSVFRL